MNEFDFINSIRRRVLPPVNPVIASIGDDCAVLPYNKTFDLLITADALSENVHFSRKYFTPWEIGARAMAANISDICAMGGVPKYAVVCMGFLKNEKQAFAASVYRGIMDYAADYSIDIIGGDTISAGCLTISITLLGRVEKGRALMRSGAKAGDHVFTTGFLGDSYAGLRVLEKKAGRKLKAFEYLPVKRHLVPAPRFVQGRQLLGSGAVNACMDISDGLVNDMTRICEESKCGAVIDYGKLPVSEQCAAVAASFNDKPGDYALYGGEDFELLFTVPQKKIGLFGRFLKSEGFTAHEIGTIKDAGGVFIKNGSSIRKAGYKKAWKHF
ncbi:MAG: thiamine-phosphate kinase [Spirochaetia bacterium]|nr:thiamine-phosphate kinase [Spirochaetia bacterium]